MFEIVFVRIVVGDLELTPSVRVDRTDLAVVFFPKRFWGVSR